MHLYNGRKVVLTSCIAGKPWMRVRSRPFAGRLDRDEQSFGKGKQFVPRITSEAQGISLGHKEPEDSNHVMALRVVIQVKLRRQSCTRLRGRTSPPPFLVDACCRKALEAIESSQVRYLRRASLPEPYPISVPSGIKHRGTVDYEDRPMWRMAW